MVKLTDEMRQALAQSGIPMLDVEDPRTKARFVLLPRAEYDRLRAMLSEEDGSTQDTYALQEAVARAQGWNDPRMDEYNDYDQKRKTA